MADRNKSCQECGMLLNDPGEFHPYIFCVLKKAGRDPWEDFRWLVCHALNVVPPKKAPLVRNLPLGRLPQYEAKSG